MSFSFGVSKEKGNSNNFSGLKKYLSHSLENNDTHN